MSFGEAVGSQESSPEVQESQTQDISTQGEDHSVQTEPQSEGNPFWKDVEEKLGPNNYKLIQPYLAKADTEARNRISELNKSYAPWKAFVDQGVTPDHVQQAFGYVQQLNDPQGQLEIYQALQTFLRENGRLPDEQELAQEIQDNADEVDPRDAQIQQLQAQLDQFQQATMGQFAAQENIRIQQEADVWADGEWKRITAAHPDLQKEDLADIAQILAAQTNRGEAPDLDKAVAQFTNMRDRIRTAPRPGQLAPRIPSGPGGGTPSTVVDPSKMTKQQRLDLVAAKLQAGRS